jgi:sodium transport system permease protein
VIRGARIVFGKEVLDNARDRRTLFSTLVIGPIFGPMLFVVLINVMLTQTFASLDDALTVPIAGTEHAPNLVAFLEGRGIHSPESHGITSLADAAAVVGRGAHDLVLVIDAEFGAALAAARGARVTIVFDQSNRRAATRVQRLEAALNAHSEQLGALRLLARGIHPDVLRPLVVDRLDVSTPASRSALLLGVLTYFLLFATLMGGYYLAIDTTAGERERRSLEPLLTTPVTRGALLTGKLAATVAYMILSLALTLTVFTIAMQFISMEQLELSSTFSALTAIKVFAVLVPFTPLGAALMVVVASFTKSYKEAQTYLGLLLVVPTLPLLFAMLLDVAPSTPLMWVPSLSQHLLITTLIREDPISPVWIAVSALSALALATLFALLARKLYEREALLG